MKYKRRLLILGTMASIPSPVLAALCRITEPNSLGPYYRKNPPFKSKLANPDEPGEKLIITGRVLDIDGCTPLNNAIVDAWHANAEGEYYDVGGKSDNTPSEYRLRGRVTTDSQGKYQFKTILPGQYSVGFATRPKHVHFIVLHPKAKPLVTQMYFSGDPHLHADRLVRESLVVDVIGNKAQFDIVLA